MALVIFILAMFGKCFKALLLIPTVPVLSFLIILQTPSGFSIMHLPSSLLHLLFVLSIFPVFFVFVPANAFAVFTLSPFSGRISFIWVFTWLSVGSKDLVSVSLVVECNSPNSCKFLSVQFWLSRLIWLLRLCLRKLLLFWLIFLLLFFLVLDSSCLLYCSVLGTRSVYIGLLRLRIQFFFLIYMFSKIIKVFFRYSLYSCVEIIFWSCCDHCPLWFLLEWGLFLWLLCPVMSYDFKCL